MEIISDTRNPLLKRRETISAIQSESNPGFEISKKKIADKFKTDVDNVVIKSLKNNFGANSFLVDALIYDSVQDKEYVEPKPKAKKSAGGA